VLDGRVGDDRRDKSHDRCPSPALGVLQILCWLGSDPLMGWWLGLAPATMEFWVRFPNERNQGKQAHPVLKYRVPHGSQPLRCTLPLALPFSSPSFFHTISLSPAFTSA
jgi:hypothetical protein